LGSLPKSVDSNPTVVNQYKTLNIGRQFNSKISVFKIDSVDSIPSLLKGNMTEKSKANNYKSFG